MDFLLPEPEGQEIYGLPDIISDFSSSRIPVTDFMSCYYRLHCDEKAVVVKQADESFGVDVWRHGCRDRIEECRSENHVALLFVPQAGDFAWL